jgi:hypothetical protein
MAASAPAGEAELQRLYARYHEDFPDVGDPPAQLADAIRSWNDNNERLASDRLREEERWIDLNRPWSERDALMAEAKQRYDNLKSERWSGTFSEHNLARLHELKGIALDQRRLHDGAALELRSALAEGYLVAFLSGDTSPIERSRWHKGDAPGVLKAGQTDGRAVVIRETDFEAWLRSGPDAIGAPVGVAEERCDGRQHDAEVEQWHRDWSKENPRASDKDAWKAATDQFPHKRIPRRTIISMRQNPDGTPRPTGRKPGKRESEFR